MKSIISSFGLVKGALELAKGLKDMLPDSTQRKAAELAIEQAEKAMCHAEIQLAVELRYHLCQCTWPPQIATRDEFGAHRCPRCKRDTNEDYKPPIEAPPTPFD